MRHNALICVGISSLSVPHAVYSLCIRYASVLYSFQIRFLCVRLSFDQLEFVAYALRVRCVRSSCVPCSFL